MPARRRTGACRRGCVGAPVTRTTSDHLAPACPALAEEKEKLEHLVRCIDALTVERDIDGVARALCDALRSAVSARRCAIYVAAVDNRGGSCRLRGAAGSSDVPPIAPRRNETYSDGGRVGLPLMRGEQILGVAHLERADDRPFGPGEVALLEMMSKVGAMAIERSLEAGMDRFIALVSHEMRTPLTATIGFAELMLQGDTGELTHDQQRALEVITRNARQLHRLVTDLLFVAQVDEPGVSLLRTPVDMKRIVMEAVESARLHAQVAGVELRADGDEAVTVLGDRERLGQLVDNLIANALKFTRAGGRVSVDARRDGDHVRLEVCDTGVGIPEAEVGRVFEAFFRTASAEAGHVPGVGLGLAVAAGIAEAHGGRIDVHSAPGRGTRFVVELPPAGYAVRPSATRGW